jgi:nitrous oxide reductase accessory protein NosL
MNMKFVLVLFTLCIVLQGLNAYAVQHAQPALKERCPVCGMFVVKYPAWLAQVHMENGGTHFFDGVKDMMAFYFEPHKYGSDSTVTELYVTDYYSQGWIDGKKAFYVVGSDAYGPMGHEFIPLDSMPAAEAFKKDHHGKEILSFDQIKLDLVNEMRSGMKGMKKMKHN